MSGEQERQNLVKMSDDLGQYLIPEITCGSAASTLLNDIKHRPSCTGSVPAVREQQRQLLHTVSVVRKLFILAGFVFLFLRTRS